MEEKRLTLEEAKKKYGRTENDRFYGVHKIFDVYINDKPHGVYRVDGYEHQYGKNNGEPCEWWLDYSTEVNQGRELVPYIDRGVHRTCWEIRYKQRNSTKHKHGEWRINSHGLCEIYANGKHVYTMANSNLASALANAHVMTEKLLYHVYDFINPENDNGRKIYYYGLPATIRTGSAPGEIWVYPDYEKIPADRWWKTYSERRTPAEDLGPREDREMDESEISEYESYGSINHGDAFWDGMINWFRK
jgi:hypothetical protein